MAAQPPIIAHSGHFASFVAICANSRHGDRLQASEIDTRGYQSLLSLVDNTTNDSFDLYYGLFMYNKVQSGHGVPRFIFILPYADAGSHAAFKLHMHAAWTLTHSLSSAASDITLSMRMPLCSRLLRSWSGWSTPFDSVKKQLFDRLHGILREQLFHDSTAVTTVPALPVARKEPTMATKLQDHSSTVVSSEVTANGAAIKTL